MNDGSSNPATNSAESIDAAPDLPTVTVDSNPDAVEAIGSANGAANEGEIEKLQELLFGNQLRAINQKIMLVHKDFKQSIAELERKLDQQIQTETGTLKNIYENASVQMLSSSNDAHDKISILEQAQAGVQVSMDDRLATLSKDIEKKLDTLNSELQEKISTGLENSKQDETYRAALSNLLSGINEKVSALETITPAPVNTAQAPAKAEAASEQQASYTTPKQEPHPLDSMLDEELEEDQIPTLTPSNNPPSAS